MVVYFQRSNGERVKLNNALTLEEINRIITNHLKEHNYKSYYRRWWKELDNSWICDVGSWSEFYIVEGVEELFF